MIDKSQLIVVFFLLFIGLLSCNWKDGYSDSNALARVGETYLYPSDIAGIVNSGISKEDSLAIISSYVNSWVKEQLILQKAKVNLTEDQQNFEQQLQNYKNSLLIYTFEEKLIEQKLDTHISETDVEIYYANNKDNFELKENIVQFKFIKVPTNAPNIDKVETWLQSNEKQDKELLNDYCVQFAEKCSFDTSRWVSFQTLLTEIPIEIENPTEFLQNRSSIHLEDSLFKYILVILDHRIKSSISPKGFVRDKIKAIILKQRRITLLNNIKQEIFEEGTIKNRYEVFISSEE